MKKLLEDKPLNISEKIEKLLEKFTAQNEAIRYVLDKISNTTKIENEYDEDEYAEEINNELEENIEISEITKTIEKT